MTSNQKSVKTANPDSKLQAIASRFVAARSTCRPLTEFPGDLPANLAAAYRIQDAAIDHWPQELGGWKVGRIPLDLEEEMGVDRLGGPIFLPTIVTAESGERRSMPIFDGGFAAVEAEYVAVIGDDAPAGKLEWSSEEAADMIADLRIGLEIASSPLVTINALGPTAVAADFGNNAGLIVGPSIQQWRTRDLDTMICETTVDGKPVGEGGAFKLTGGFVRSVQFLLELAARRQRPLRAGTVIATGQTTGIHDVLVGETTELDFGRDGVLSCTMVAAEPA